MIDRDHDVSLARQAELLGISRGGAYYVPKPVPDSDLALMRRIDGLHLEHPFMGARLLRDTLNREGFRVGRRHVATLMARMGIEEAFLVAKRLLGLSYFWSGAQNAMELQVWAIWLLYAVLIDLTDAVAEALNQPASAVSVEMVFRSLHYAADPCLRGGEAPSVVAYLAANAKLLGIIKRPCSKPKPRPSPRGLDGLEEGLTWD